MGEQLPPGRELDGEIARHVFDWVGIDANARWRRWEYGDPGDEWTMIEWSWCRGLGKPPHLKRDRYPYPRYSESIAAAWSVVDHLLSNKTASKFDISYSNTLPLPWTVHFLQTRLNSDPWSLGQFHVYAEAETAPHAICLCALKVVRATLDP